MQEIKKTAQVLAKTLNIKNITLESLQTALRKNGFVIHKYSDSDTLLMTFGLYDEAKEADSVSAIDKSGIPYIFINDKIDKPFQLFALAHEMGHLRLKHRKTISLKRQQEREADLFAHYLLSYDNKPKAIIILTVITIILSIGIILVAIPTVINNALEKESISAPAVVASKKTVTDTENDNVCYFTRSSEVYHIYKDCYYIENSANVYCDTIEHSHKDRLCSACERRLKNK